MKTAAEERLDASFFANNRKKLIDSIKKETPDKCSLICLVGAKGESRHDTDRDLICRQESNFFYLTGVEGGDFCATIEVPEGKFRLYAPQLPPAYAVWMGSIPTCEELKEKHNCDECVFRTDESDTFIEALKKGSEENRLLFSTRNMVKHLPADKISSFNIDVVVLPDLVAHLRVIKSPEEVKVMKEAAGISVAAVKSVMKNTRGGMREFEASSLFRYECARRGCVVQAFETIAAGGPRANTLHYMDNLGVLKEGEFLLLDAGGELATYASDITRTFPVGGKFTPLQKEVYETVLRANQAVIEALKPGVSWPDMHRLAEKVIATGLIENGFVSDLTADEICEKRIVALFMPHGLGHYLGLDTHDVGGFIKGKKRIDEEGLRNLRCVQDMEKGMVMTVEPGMYFIPALLNPAFEKETVGPYLNREKIERCLKEGVGGVRIEDDVLVTEDGCEVWTVDAPKTVADIEAWIAE